MGVGVLALRSKCTLPTGHSQGLVSADLHRSALLSPFVDEETKVRSHEAAWPGLPAPKPGLTVQLRQEHQGVETSNQGVQAIQAKGWVG